VSVPFALALFATVIGRQPGMLTVTWQLKPLIVDAAPAVGMNARLLWWLMLSLPRSSWGAAALKTPAVRSAAAAPRRLRAPAVVLAGLAALAVQRARRLDQHQLRRGRLPDFPTCRAPGGRRRLPNAFVLWHGLNIDYEAACSTTRRATAIM